MVSKEKKKWMDYYKVLEKRVTVNITRRFIHKKTTTFIEPLSWYKYTNTASWVCIPCVFLRFLLYLIGKNSCCSHSSTKYVINFKHTEEEEEFHSKKYDEAFAFLLEEGKKFRVNEKIEKDLLYPGLWKAYHSYTRSRCFSCGDRTRTTCDNCFVDKVILEEAIHIPHLWSSFGNQTFVSTPLPSITYRNLSCETELKDYVRCVLFTREVEEEPYCNADSMRTEEEEGRITNICAVQTVPIDYFITKRFCECKNIKGSDRFPSLFILCAKKIYHLQEEQTQQEPYMFPCIKFSCWNRRDFETYIADLPLPETVRRHLIQYKETFQYCDMANCLIDHGLRRVIFIMEEK